jgi:hypothetical protein
MRCLRVYMISIGRESTAEHLPEFRERPIPRGFGPSSAAPYKNNSYLKCFIKDSRKLHPRVSESGACLGMRPTKRWGRRSFLAWCLQAAAFLPVVRALSAEESAPRNVLANLSARRVVRYRRHFRTQATVLILGIPIFRRDDVGAGCATVELGIRSDDTVSALQFAAGSQPERARGLNRFGALWETAVETSARLTEAVGAGFITSSPEKTLDQARTALQPAGPAVPCAFSSSSSGFGRTEVKKGRFTASGIKSWVDAPGILRVAEQESRPNMQEETWPLGPVATFLYSIRHAVLNPDRRIRRQFCHNGEFCELITERTSASSSSTGVSGSRVQMSGVILDSGGAKKSEFSIWIDPDDPSGLPIRIEFYPRSYLRLTFEAQSPSQAETLPWLLKEEPA